MEFKVFQNAWTEYLEWQKDHKPWNSFDAGVITYIEKMLYTGAAAEERGDYEKAKEYYWLIIKIMEPLDALELSYSKHPFTFDDDEKISSLLAITFGDYAYYYMHPYGKNRIEGTNFKPKDYQGVALNKAAWIVEDLISKSNSEKDIYRQPLANH